MVLRENIKQSDICSWKLRCVRMWDIVSPLYLCLKH